jgi:hypothetical protein
MKRMRIFLMCLAYCAAFSAAAQWQWMDKGGRKVFSDRPPPPDITDKDILKRPAGTLVVPVADPPARPASGASAPRAAASIPRLSGRDAQLEARKKDAENQEAAKQKAEDDKLKQAQADNCNRVRSAKSGLDSGLRVQTMNDKGEAGFMSDQARAAESQRLQELLKDCS